MTIRKKKHMEKTGKYLNNRIYKHEKFGKLLHLTKFGYLHPTKQI
jgi:hypothetical protein